MFKDHIHVHTKCKWVDNDMDKIAYLDLFTRRLLGKDLVSGVLADVVAHTKMADEEFTVIAEDGRLLFHVVATIRGFLLFFLDRRLPQLMARKRAATRVKLPDARVTVGDFALHAVPGRLGDLAPLAEFAVRFEVRGVVGIDNVRAG